MIYFLINTDKGCGGTVGTEPLHKNWTNVPYLGGFVKEFWNGSAWIESASPEELNKVLVPKQVKKLQFKKALVKSGISTSLITNTIYSMPDSLVKDKFIILWEDSEFFERDNKELNTMAVQFNITQEQLDQLFILADTL